MPLSSKRRKLCHGIVIQLLFTIALSGCGKIGDPIPPDLVFPLAITDLTAQVKKSDCLNYYSKKSNMAGVYFGEKD